MILKEELDQLIVKLSQKDITIIRFSNDKFMVYSITDPFFSQMNNTLEDCMASVASNFIKYLQEKGHNVNKLCLLPQHLENLNFINLTIRP